MTAAQPAFGIASFAHYHAHHWSQAALDDVRVRFIGIWDNEPERGRAVADQYDVPFVPNLDELAAACDGIGVTSETSRHAEIIEVVAGHGVSVLCEKPLATSVSECLRIKEIVDRTGVRFMMNLPKRHDPANHALRDLLASGSIGEPVLTRIRHGHNHGQDDDFRRAWFQDRKLSGGGTLIDEGVHAADLLRWLFGMPAEVEAMVSNACLGLAVDDTAVAVFSYQGGPIAEIATSWCFEAAESSVEVFGTRGTAILGGVDLASRDHCTPPYLKYLSRSDGPSSWQGIEVMPGFLSPAFHEQGPREFFRCLSEATAPTVTLNDGVQSLALIEAAYRAAQSGRRVTIGVG